jgi:hypothetical protein
MNLTTVRQEVLSIYRDRMLSLLEICEKQLLLYVRRHTQKKEKSSTSQSL